MRTLTTKSAHRQARPPRWAAQGKGNPPEQLIRESPSHHSPTHIAIHVRRMRRFIATTLAGTDGLRLLLSTYALVAAGARIPEVMLFFAGEGGEGESLLLSTLGRAVWGSGNSEASGDIPQGEEEFRKQRHLYRKLRWMSFGESKPLGGLSGEIFKLLCSGGMLALR